MSAQAISPPALSCEVRIPGPDDRVRDHLDRWSDAHVSLPKALIAPESERDVIAALQYAKAHSLRVVVGGGGHATFVPITDRTLYLDMQRFKGIAIDEESSTVTVGGGVFTGELLAALAEKGYYTTLPYADGPGVVGAFLGGGNNSFNSLHGFMVDQVMSARIVTAAADEAAARVVSPASSDADERALFAALCGAGHGLGAVVSATLRVYPIRSLAMDDDRMWQRRIMFPGAAKQDAAGAFCSMLPVRGPVQGGIICTRAPAASPHPGAPVIVLLGSHFGPVADAEKSAMGSVLLAPETAQSAAMAVTVPVAVAEMNFLVKPSEVHGGRKILDSVFVTRLDPETILNVFERYEAFTDSRPDTFKSQIAIATWDNTKMTETERSEEGRARRFFEARDMSIGIFVTVWTTEEESEAAGVEFLADLKEILRRGGAGPFKGFANNLRFPADLKQYYSEERLEELHAIKQRWDPEGLFWSPAMGAE